MPRSLWHGAISFGLIYVPVDLFSASRDSTLSMHLLDSRDFAAVGYQRVNKKTGKEVAWEHIVKGYEYRKGQFVALTDADFKQANLKASETIQISSFTAATEIPAMYFETPYYLAPRKGGEKVYALLRQALQGTKKVAVATFVMRGRQHLCAVAPNAAGLMLLTLRFSSEILPAVAGKDSAAAPAVSSAELAMAKKLVEGMSGAFRPEQFKDTYRTDLLRRIKEKVKKKQWHSLEAETALEDDRPKAKVIDLMEALKNSLRMKARAGARAAPKSAAHRKRA